MRPVVLTVNQWISIKEELHTEYPLTVFMLRSKMKRVLGFTVREHKTWIPKPDGGYSDFQIHLDFYSENKRTMFLLKFSEIIAKE
jgi:hypothetical protein